MLFAVEKWNTFFSSDSLAISVVTWDFVHLLLLHFEGFHFCRIVVCSYVLSGALECTEAVQRNTQTFLTSRKVLFSVCSPPFTITTSLPLFHRRMEKTYKCFNSVRENALDDHLMFLYSLELYSRERFFHFRNQPC